MISGNLTIEIDKKINDKMFMEYCLNLVSSSYDPTLFIVFYSLGRNWHIDKFVYLQELINDLKEVVDVK